MERIDDKKLSYLEYLNRENSFRHHLYSEDMLRFDLMKSGDPRAIEEGENMFASSLLGHLSDDPLRNMKYLFVSTVAIATRYAIEGGMNEEKAYNASDLFIQEADLCKNIEEVKKLNKEMFIFFTTQLSAIHKGRTYSKPVMQCIDYIYYHLYEKLTLGKVATVTRLNPNYLSQLFHKELGITFSDYINKERVTAAKNMLRHSDFSYSDIASILGYSSQSHFIQNFKVSTGYTPKKYRNEYYKAGYMKKN